MSNKDAIQFIKDELTKRIDKNPNYSLRAFSSLLQMNIGTLSSILNGKRTLTKKSLEQICNRLNVSPNQKQKVLKLVSKYRSSIKGADDDGISKDRVRLEHETYKAMTEWYHWAILQLVRLDIYGTKPQHATAKWFATRLEISELNAKLALERLVDLRMLKIEDGFYKRTEEHFTTKNKTVTSPSLRQWQKGLREKAIESLEKDPIDIRSMTSMTMAVDMEKFPEARVIIAEFQEKMCKFLEEGKKDKVYQLTVSLFPLEKRGEKL